MLDDLKSDFEKGMEEQRKAIAKKRARAPKKKVQGNRLLMELGKMYVTMEPFIRWVRTKMLPYLRTRVLPFLQKWGESVGADIRLPQGKIKEQKQTKKDEPEENPEIWSPPSYRM